MTNAKSLFLTAFVTLGLIHSAALAQEDMSSGSFFLEACRAAANGNVDNAPGTNSFTMGICVGEIQALWFGLGNNIMQLNSVPLRSCLPKTITPRELTRAVVAYLDRHPSRLHEPLEGLILLAFADTWPCR